MAEIPSNIAKLSAVQVNSLLGIGLSSDHHQTETDLSELDAQERDTAIRLILADLAVPLSALNRGPLSFARLTNLRPDEMSSVADKTILEVVASGSVSRSCLDALLEYGKFLFRLAGPESSRLCGAVICALTTAKLESAFQVATDAVEVQACVGVLDSLIGQDVLSAAFRTAAQDARSALSNTTRVFTKQ